MNTIKEIQEEQGKGIHSIFNACMHKGECCNTATALADREREVKNLKALLDNALRRLELYEKSGMQLIGTQVFDSLMAAVPPNAL